MPRINESSTFSICQVRRSPPCPCPPEGPSALASTSKPLYASLWAPSRAGLGSKPSGAPRESCMSYGSVCVAEFVWIHLITDPASVMFPPVFLEGDQQIADPPRWFPRSSTGWCSPPLTLILPMLLHVVPHKRKEVRFLVILRVILSAPVDPRPSSKLLPQSSWTSR